MSKSGTHKQPISAKTGQFVSAAFAAKHPSTTVVLTVKNPPKKKS